MSIVKEKKRGRPSKVKAETIKSDYMNVQEVADLLKMSASHVYTLTSTKKIPHIKLLGKKVLFDKDEIKNWLKSKSVSAK
jgi:excisionase family DNA binding protein